jgi:hypothetical protein
MKDNNLEEMRSKDKKPVYDFLGLEEKEKKGIC